LAKTDLHDRLPVRPTLVPPYLQAHLRHHPQEFDLTRREILAITEEPQPWGTAGPRAHAAVRHVAWSPFIIWQFACSRITGATLPHFARGRSSPRIPRGSALLTTVNGIAAGHSNPG